MHNRPIASLCANCGALFASRSMFLGGGTIIGLKVGINHEPCPFCRAQASTLPGIYDMVEGVLKLVSGPEFSKQMHRQLVEVLTKAYEQKLSPEEITREAKRVNPALVPAIKGLLRYKSVLSAIIVAIAASKCTFSFDIKLDVNHLIEQVMDRPPAQVLQRSETHPKHGQGPHEAASTRTPGDCAGDECGPEDPAPGPPLRT